MTNQHPITPPPELIQQWRVEFFEDKHRVEDTWGTYFATQAARWGADQELNACIAFVVEWLRARGNSYALALATALATARRPKPPSLKEQALAALREAESTGCLYVNGRSDLIRKALEQLND